MVNPIKSLRESLGKIPTKYRFWTSLGILAALLIALPVTLIGLMTGTFELRKMATGEVVPTPYPCECRSGVDNFCLYPPQTLNCPMTFPGGYCDPNGDASFDDADWEGGYYEYQRLCGGAPITPGPASCGQSCGPDTPCAPGLMCGTPCPPGQVCAQYMRCYNPSCPYDQDCICPTPTGIQMTPTPTPRACTPEGQTMPVYPGYSCCPGLEAISPNKPDAKGNCPDYPLLGASVCVKDCGNGQCTLGENKCNCPEDCPSVTPTQTVKTLRLKLIFAGVTSRPRDDSDKQVQIYADNLTGGPGFGSATNKQTVTIKVDDSGIYHGEIVLSSDHFGHHYRLRVKGPRHLQEVFLNVVFLAEEELDLTNQPLRPGDLNVDGKVDVSDIKIINERMFSTNPTDLTLADINFDKIVDIVDRTRVLNTLSVQYDPD